MKCASILVLIGLVATLVCAPVSVAEMTPPVTPESHIQLETIQTSPDSDYVLSNTPADKSQIVERPGFRTPREYQCIRRAGLITCFR
jgi:hypothetical protein